jgi:hypothetical protein
MRLRTVRSETDSESAAALMLNNLVTLFFLLQSDFRVDISPPHRKKTFAFTSSHVAEIVGITPTYLNALVHRKLYGISASISDRHGVIKFRFFSEEDVFAIALVWTLFESGLRTESIRSVLYGLADTDEPDANAAVEFLARSEIDYLGIIREPSKGKASPKIRVEPTTNEYLNTLVKECVERHPTANIVLVPVGQKFADISKKMNVMYGE